MAVPCHALDSNYGDVAPEAAEAFNQCYIRAGTSSGSVRRPRSQSASGALQAAQVNNQLLVQISQQLADLIALQAAHSRAQTLVAAANATDQNQGTGQLSTFLTRGSGYQPQTVQMFHQ